MRVVFAGTPTFASTALEALVQAGHEVCLVLTQPDRAAGRGMKVSPSAVGATAERLALPVAKPTSLREEQAVHAIAAAQPEVMVVAAYGLILPPGVLGLPPRGCVNIHASLLPRWRGAAPVHRAVLAGDEVTGVCIMQMDAGLDTGPVLLERPLAIGPRDTTGTLIEKLSRLGAQAVVDALSRLDDLRPRPQDAARATYANKIAKSEAVLDFARPALVLERQVRAFNPSPGAEATIDGVRFKVWEAEVEAGAALAPGSVMSDGGVGFLVGCSEGALRVLTAQRDGGRKMGAAEFLRGKPWPGSPTSA